MLLTGLEKLFNVAEEVSVENEDNMCQTLTNYRTAMASGSSVTGIDIQTDT